jgi:hypothetical protein
MKHSLLILISLLLLSSPVIGNTKKWETLYFWKTSSSLSWKGFGNKETHPKYQGDVVSGKPNGLGILTYPWGTKYVGEWKDGRFWYGIGDDTKGNIVGKYVNGVNIIKEPMVLVEKKPLVLVEKKPVVVVEKKPVVVVEKKQTSVLFRRGEDRQWRWFSNVNNKNDRIYVGDILNGKPNGQGTYTYPSGDKYVGEFNDGEYHGQGKFTFHDGSKYVGEFRDGKVWNGEVYQGKNKDKIVNGEWIK